MAVTGEYLLTHILEPVPEERFKQFPQNAMIVPWFQTSEISGLRAGLEECARELPPVVVHVGAVALKPGSSHAERQLLEDTEEIRNTHQSFLKVVQNVGEIKQATSIAENYQPYVTKRGVKTLRPSGAIKIDRVSLIQKVSRSGKLVIATFDLMGDETAA